MKRLLLLAVLSASACTTGVDGSARTASWPNAYQMMNGVPLHRATLTPTAGGAEDNVTASGGAAVAYTFLGGERVCVQTPEAAYIQVIAAASFGASGILSFRVNANESLFANCFTLGTSQTKVSGDCVSGACAGIKLFEVN